MDRTLISEVTYREFRGRPSMGGKHADESSDDHHYTVFVKCFSEQSICRPRHSSKLLLATDAFKRWKCCYLTTSWDVDGTIPSHFTIRLMSHVGECPPCKL